MSKILHFLISCFVILSFLFLLINLSETKSFAQSWKKYPNLKTGSKIEFPRDEGFHPEEAMEWWYANGHFTGHTTGNQYSFMLAYFHKPVSIFDGFRILTITNETKQEISSQVLPCAYSILSMDSLHILATFVTGDPSEEWVNQVDGSGTMLPFQYLIKASAGEDSIKLNLDATKPPLLIDEDGFLYQGSGNYSYYYSLTNLIANGSVTFKGVEEDISGIAWFDRQYGSFDPYEDESYEWLSVQLEENMDLNIWNIFTPENSIPMTKEYRICSILKNDTISFTTQNFQIERLAFAFTPDSQKCYATSWRIISDTLNMDLQVEVNNERSEINISEIALRFFEGSTKINGKLNNAIVSGVGFAELLHTYEKPILQFIQPGVNNQWHYENPLIWKVKNPDDGNPLKFNVEIEYQSPFQMKIAGGIEDTVFYWNPSVFSTESDFEMIVTTYSIDTTLKDFAKRKFLLEPENTDLNACTGENFYIDLNLNNENLFFNWLYNNQAAGFPEISLLEISPVTMEYTGVYSCQVYNEFFQDTTLEFHLNVDACNNTVFYKPGDIIVYPIPFTEFLDVHLNLNTDRYLLRIKSLWGIVVYETTVTGMTDNFIFPCISPGMYILEMISPGKERIWTSKIVRR
jgi:predicted secreted hydrolase